MHAKIAIAAFTLILFQSVVQAQMSNLLDNVSDFEKDMVFYDKAPEAKAVILNERGDNFFTQRIKGYGSSIYLIKQFYRKTKIFKKEAFDLGSIKIPFYESEKIENLKAITHNGNTQYEVPPTDIHLEKVNKFESQYVFFFSNIKEGSIIEYQYDKVTPYYGKLTGWNFQTTIPKIHSEFNAKIPGHLKYNRAFFGELKLDVNSAEMEEHCFKASFIQTDCETLKYSMKDIPAFIIEPKYMLSHYNYISRLEFDLAEIDYNQYGKSDISTTWEELDRDFMQTEGIGTQLLQNAFFKRKVPGELLQGGDKLSRAKKIFEFVKNHYTWDMSFGGYRFNDVRGAFKAKKGSVAEINMTLINLLNTAGIRTTLMLSSTRQNVLPKKSHPSISDFNYFLARFVMDGKIYLLDASDKEMPFGMIPFKALNQYGRVMDFERKSYWHNIKAYAKNRYQVRARVEFDMESETAFGNMDVLSLGYNAIELRNLKEEKNEEEYLNILSTHFQNNLEVISYKQVQERSDEKKVSERIQFNVEILTSGDRIYFNPFLIQFFKQNPFLKEERDYPIDFGYPRHYKYQINISIPEGYELLDLPKKDVIRLGDNMASLKYFNSQNEKAIMISFDFSVNSTYFEPTDYEVLRKLFSRIVEIQNNTLLVLKKVKS